MRRLLIFSAFLLATTAPTKSSRASQYDIILNQIAQLTNQTQILTSQINTLAAASNSPWGPSFAAGGLVFIGTLLPDAFEKVIKPITSTVISYIWDTGKKCYGLCESLKKSEIDRFIELDEDISENQRNLLRTIFHALDKEIEKESENNKLYEKEVNRNPSSNRKSNRKSTKIDDEVINIYNSFVYKMPNIKIDFSCALDNKEFDKRLPKKNLDVRTYEKILTLIEPHLKPHIGKDKYEEFKENFKKVKKDGLIEIHAISLDDIYVDFGVFTMGGQKEEAFDLENQIDNKNKFIVNNKDEEEKNEKEEKKYDLKNVEENIIKIESMKKIDRRNNSDIEDSLKKGPLFSSRYRLIITANDIGKDSTFLSSQYFSKRKKTSEPFDEKKN